jgi:hypothetical protein
MVNIFGFSSVWFTKNFILLFIFSFASFFSAFAVNDWELKKNESGIAIYTRDIPGSSFKELKVLTSFNTSLTSIVALIEDVSSYPLWIYQCKEGKLIKMVGDSELYYYHVTSTPWPVSNRDGIVHYKITQNVKTKVVNVSTQSVQGIIDKIPGIVRVPKMQASWKLTPQPDGSINAEYQLYVDPGGSLPAWIVNMFLVDGPYSTFQNMKKIVTQDKYQSSKFSFIKE